eukprot:352652-Chlamydomonas_euryale.AAC.3
MASIQSKPFAGKRLHNAKTEVGERKGKALPLAITTAAPLAIAAACVPANRDGCAFGNCGGVSHKAAKDAALWSSGACGWPRIETATRCSACMTPPVARAASSLRSQPPPASPETAVDGAAPRLTGRRRRQPSCAHTPTRAWPASAEAAPRGRSRQCPGRTCQHPAHASTGHVRTPSSWPPPGSRSV